MISLFLPHLLVAKRMYRNACDFFSNPLHSYLLECTKLPSYHVFGFLWVLLLQFPIWLSHSQESNQNNVRIPTNGLAMSYIPSLYINTFSFDLTLHYFHDLFLPATWLLCYFNMSTILSHWLFPLYPHSKSEDSLTRVYMGKVNIK